MPFRDDGSQGEQDLVEAFFLTLPLPTTKLWVKGLSLMHKWATCCQDNGRGVLFLCFFFLVFLSTTIAVSSYVLNASL